MSVPSAKNLLTEPITRLNGIDTTRATLLARLGVTRGMDLLFLFPRAYQQPAPETPVERFADAMRVTFAGTVVDIAERISQSGKHILGVQVTPDGGGSVRLLWFNQAFRKENIQRGDRLVITGELKSTVLNWEMVHPQTFPAGGETIDLTKPIPVYPLTEGLSQSTMRFIMRKAIPQLTGHVEEVLPEPIRLKLDVPGIRRALEDIHSPPTIERAETARRRFKLQELLVLQLALSMQRRQREKSTHAPACDTSGLIHARILNRLEHELTPDQESAIDDIRRDMAKSIPMNRLLQGDVGSGKTLVAQYAMLLCVASQHQAVLMAPTEILARQHANNLKRSLSDSRVRIGLLTGSLSRSERKDTLNQLSSGQVDLVVGTQSLLSEQVQFNHLGLVIVDEQHKFGVLQRAKMRREGIQPHYLVLSATPIPRTIAMSLFGDLDVSIIRTKPPGRSEVKTYVASAEQLASWWQFVERQLEKGRQAYVIAPRVGESAEDESVANAQNTFERLREGSFRHRRLGLLHGKMTGQAKESILEDFASRRLDILVATTVVEVGIDVPNATVITILDADRLGLAQLHQLRGRISRGSVTGFACAVASPGANIDENERLKAFAKSNDGFELAELDLRIRGSGDLLGTSQTGLPPLKVANLIDDADLLELARTTAREILTNDPELTEPSLSRLVNQTLRRYGKSLQLADVG